MRLSIRGSRTRLSPQTRAYIERRAYFSLSRFAARVAGIRVRLSGPAGGRRGGVRTCTVVLTVPGSPPLAVEQRETRVKVAVDTALARAARLLARTIELLDGRMAAPTRWRLRPGGRR